MKANKVLDPGLTCSWLSIPHMGDELICITVDSTGKAEKGGRKSGKRLSLIKKEVFAENKTKCGTTGSTLLCHVFILFSANFIPLYPALVA